MNAGQHFVLSFFGPIIAGGVVCGVVGLSAEFLKRHQLPVPVFMLAGFVVAAVVTRWWVRNYVSVSCPFCGGKSFEIPRKGNRFMCTVCAKDH